MSRVAKGILYESTRSSVPESLRGFYSNLKFEDPSLNSSIKGVEIDIHRDQFGKMFELPFYGV